MSHAMLAPGCAERWARLSPQKEPTAQLGNKINFVLKYIIEINMCLYKVIYIIYIHYINLCVYTHLI